MSSPLPPSSSYHRPWYRTVSGLILIGVVAVLLGLLIVLAGFVIRYLQTVDTSRITLLPPATNQLTETGSVGELYVTEDDPAAGAANAKVQIVEFGDFQCPFCRQASGIVRRIMADYGDRIHFVYRDFPVSEIHPLAQKAAEAGECAQEQGTEKFWALHDKFFQHQNKLSLATIRTFAVQVGLQEDAFNACLDSGRYAAEVEEDFQAGLQANVSGTPTFFINGYQLAGVVSEDVFRHAIDLILESK